MASIPGTDRGRSATVAGSVFASFKHGIWMMSFCNELPRLPKLATESNRALTSNFQFPTPKAIGSHHLGESRCEWRCCPDFHPARSKASPWELGVGRWELTAYFHRLFRRNSRPGAALRDLRHELRRRDTGNSATFGDFTPCSSVFVRGLWQFEKFFDDPVPCDAARDLVAGRSKCCSLRAVARKTGGCCRKRLWLGCAHESIDLIDHELVRAT
jgi:hypothetical protein